MNNSDLLKRIDGALKAITVSDLGSSKLATQKQQQFVKTVSQATTMMDVARRIDMSSHTHDIDRVGFGNRILGKAVENTAPGTDSKPDFATNTLESIEVIAVAGITDSTMEDNIEQDQFENTLLDLIADRAGVDLEELFINGDKAAGADDFLKLTNGWLNLAANSVTGGTGLDFAANDSEGMFDSMIGAVPKKYLRDRSQWTFWTHWDIEDDYRNELRSRGTGLGDSAQTTANGLAYKGFSVRESSNMPEGSALLAPNNNLVYGLYRDVFIEPDRQAKKRSTDFVCTLRVDCNYEDENAAVAASGFVAG